MLKRKSKIGWMRTIEVFFAVLIIAVVVLIVVQHDQDQRRDVSSRIHGSIVSIIRDIELNNSLRTEIVSISDSGLAVEWEEFNATVPQTLEKIVEKTPTYLECVGKICSTDDVCLLDKNPDKSVYAESVIITSDLETYRPRVLKLFCWEAVVPGTGSAAVCGDSIVDSGEQCDDGNTANGDGCSSSCQIETIPVCGNTIIEAGEQCDDGNVVSGDGCSSSCQIEIACGNGIIEPQNGEQCDDGNTANGDGCSSICENETITYLAGCQEITSPGTYFLFNNLTGTAPDPCIYIHDTSQVYFNCQDHSVTVPGLVTGQAVAVINNTIDFSLRNCAIPVTSVPNGEIPQSLEISNSGEGEINSNTFSGGSLFNVGYSWNLEVLNNTFNESAYQQALTSYTIIEGNWLDFNYSGAALILANDGEGNIIRGNTINGEGGGEPFLGGNNWGFDSGIAFDGQNNIEVAYNNITGVWNCGISMLGLIQNSLIMENNISNAGFCGIGGWYWMSLQNNVFANNTIDNSGPMFTIYRRYSLKPGEEFVYFTDNVFTDNILTNKNNFRNYATDIDMNRSNWGEVADSAFVSSNATFTNNNFGTDWPGPYISPRSAIIDGGGNICGPPSLGQNTSPLVCN